MSVYSVTVGAQSTQIISGGATQSSTIINTGVSTVFLLDTATVDTNSGTPLLPNAGLEWSANTPCYGVVSGGVGSVNVQSPAVAYYGAAVSINTNVPVEIVGSVDIGNTPSVTIDTTGGSIPVNASGTVNIGNSPTVNIDSTTPVNVAATGTVDIGNSPTVTIDSATPVNVAATGTVSIGNTPNVSISNTPSVIIDTAAGSVPVDATGSVSINTTSGPVSVATSGTVEANITNATLTVAPGNGAVFDVNVGNAIDATITGGTVTIANQVSTEIAAQSITLDTNAAVSNTVIGTNPTQFLGSDSLGNVSFTTGQTLGFNFNENAEVMLCDELYLVINNSGAGGTDFTVQLNNVVDWTTPFSYEVLNLSGIKVYDTGVTVVYKFLLPEPLLVNGFTFQLTNNNAGTVVTTFTVKGYGRYASTLNTSLLPPGSAVDYSTKLTVSTSVTVAPAVSTRKFLLVQNAGSSNISLGIDNSNSPMVLFPGQGYEANVSSNPFITGPVTVVGAVNTPVACQAWQ